VKKPKLNLDGPAAVQLATPHTLDLHIKLPVGDLTDAQRSEIGEALATIAKILSQAKAQKP
jgi:hypothetical protein